MNHLIIDCIFALVVSLLFYAYKYVTRCYNDITLYELLYYVKMPLKGANAGPFVKEIPGILINIICTIAIVICSDLFFPLNWVLICSLLLIFDLALLIYHFKALTFIRLSFMTTKLYEDEYKAPENVNLEFPENKRNLIYIFMESMETCYSILQNGKTDYMTELSQFAATGSDFSKPDEINGAYAVPGATFTTGAMLSHLSGVPVNLCIPGSKGKSKGFLPNLTMLGDILAKEGYNQEFVLGSDITFGGRLPLMKDHGDQKIFDYIEAKKSGRIPNDYHVFWGMEDEKLFENAKTEVLELAKSDEPFSLTLLTVDTHFLDGYKCRLCPDTFNDQYGNAIACSSKQISNFISWLKQQPFYENTTIVLCGDHPTMDSGFIKRAGLRNEARKSYVSYLNTPANLTEYPHEYTTLDLFPTTLAALGVKIEGNRLGLGTNLFSNEKTLYEKLGQKRLDNELTKKSKYYKSFFKGVKL